MEPLLCVENFSVSYNGKTIFKDVNFSLNSGEVLAITGRSGIGKSTVLKAAQGILPQNAHAGGSIYFEGADILKLDKRSSRKLAGTKIATVFQDSLSSFCPVRKIGEQLFEALRAHTDISYDEFIDKAKVIMERLHLSSDIFQMYPFNLSGGMGQRVGILAAMLPAPKLILADEPTSALDTVTSVAVVKEFLELKKMRDTSLIIVTHNPSIASYMADKVFNFDEVVK